MQASILKPDYPPVVNSIVTRIVAFITLLLAAGYLFSGSAWVLAYMLFEFLIRYLYGPRFSPVARLGIQIASHSGLAPRMVAGQPKRFAQAIGTAFALTALVLHTGGLPDFAILAMLVLSLFAALEAGIGFCAACLLFGFMIRLGWVQPESCEACSNLAFQQPNHNSASNI